MTPSGSGDSPLQPGQVIVDEGMLDAVCDSAQRLHLALEAIAGLPRGRIRDAQAIASRAVADEPTWGELRAAKTGQPGERSEGESD